MTVAHPASGPIRRLTFDPAVSARPNPDVEWLVTNGLGGYASGPVAGGLTRRYHGLLIAALPAPLGRMLYFTHLRVSVLAAGQEFIVDHEDSRLEQPNVVPLVEFRLESGLPIWTYKSASFTLEKRVAMPHGENTVHVAFRVSASTGVTLRIAPLFHVRRHDGPVGETSDPPPVVKTSGETTTVETSPGWPTLSWRVTGAPVRAAFGPPVAVPIEYPEERQRGYDFAGSLWMPGWMDIALGPDQESASFMASAETPRSLDDHSTDGVFAAETTRRNGIVSRAAPADDMAAELALAADQFLVTPASRAQEVAAARAAGEKTRSVFAGYHWFTDWGRDTMIGLEGLTLETGQPNEAANILRTFAHHVRDGLIPNLFPEGERHGLYHTADATLWFFHAVDRYVTRTHDWTIVHDLAPAFIEIVQCHLAGTKFGIHVDPADGLLVQGAPHYQLTWMDAKVGDWVVTPRRGKAVEINALWYNALSVAAAWFDKMGLPEAGLCRTAASRAHDSFNRRFWNETAGHLNDVVDGEQGDDPACRPNQVFAISLPHPILDQARWAAVLDVVERTLLTPFGLRSLAPGHPDYQAKYFGDLRARDAAYHQGTVWAWLIGPFIDAWLKVHAVPPSEARRFLEGFRPHLDAACVGSVSEIFDAQPPFAPRGCIAQAWSVAELLRVWKRTER